MKFLSLFSVLCLAAPLVMAADMESLVAEAHRRFESELAERDAASWFDVYQAYSSKLLDDSAGTNSYRDKTGNCRLAWFDRLLRNQRTSAIEAERFSRELHAVASARKGVFAGLVTRGFAVTDVPLTENAPANRLEGFNFLTNSLDVMWQGREQAFAPFAPGERADLFDLLAFQTMGGTNRLGHRFGDTRDGRAACDGMGKIDRRGLARAGLAAAALADRWREGRLDRWLSGLAGLSATIGVKGVEGSLAGVWNTPHGLVVVGGTGTNVYRLDDNPAIAAVLDLGGDDLYEEGTVGEHRPVLVILDRAGADRYRGRNPGIQGGAFGGISVLLDGGGSDRYEAGDLAQGACLAGVGILADADGNDTYYGDRRVQGHAAGGIAILWDAAGNDWYTGAVLAQGVGAPLGFGLLEDLAGNDAYFAGGRYPGGYDDTPGFGGWSQGVGVGPRGSGNGGVGVLLDGAGDDLYEYDYFCHGGGYWFAVGVARDFGGNDRRIGSTRTNWDGTPRTEKPFVRWGPAYGCHFALGFLFDDGGDDLYTGNSAGVGFAWDIAVGSLFDLSGNDRYVGGNGGFASQSSLSMLVDGGGDDDYRQSQPGYAGPTSAYHPVVTNNSNFALTLDLGGNDTWACGLSNGQERVQGWGGGILIDR